MQPEASYQRILRTTSIVGGASALSLLVGLVKTKVIALSVGPAGIGLLGILLTLIATWTSVAGLGLMSSGVRELAAASENRKRQYQVRRALWVLTFLAAAAGALLLWLAREPLAAIVLDGEIAANQLGWIALAVAFGILSGTQAACLQGFRRIGDLARMQLGGSVLAAVISIALVLIYGGAAIVLLALLPSLTATLMGWWFVRRLPGCTGPWPSGREMILLWRGLAALGLAITATAIIGSLSQTAARSLIIGKIGLHQSGLFQAAYTISAVNLGIVLAAMASDYYPRLSQNAGDAAAMSQVVDDQLRVTIALAAPALALIQLLASPLLALLFSSEFRGASELLRWMIAADALRVSGWAIGFVLLAAGNKLGYFLVEAAFGLVFIPVLALLLPHIGLDAGGLAYFVAYVASLLLAVRFATRRHRLALARRHLFATSLLTASLASIPLVHMAAPLAATVLAALFATAWTSWSLTELRKMGLMPNWRSVVTRLRAGAPARWQ